MNLFCYRGVSRNGDYFSDEYKQYLCFSVKFFSFNLTHRRNRQNWTDAQQETHNLIKSLISIDMYVLLRFLLKTTKGICCPAFDSACSNDSQIFNLS